MFASLYSNTNQELFEKRLCMQKSTDDFSLRKGSHHVQKKLTLSLALSTVSKDEWNTKEDTGKSLKNTLDILQ